jgi:hypothetical protein
MSDFLDRRREQIQQENQRSQTAEASRVAAGGGGPHDPGMESRVAALEANLRTLTDGIVDIKATLGTMSVTLSTLSTKAELATTGGDIKVLASRIEAHSDRLKTVEDAVNDTVKTALGKSIGGYQLPGIIVSTAVALGLLALAYAWLLKQPWFPH